MNDKHDKKKYCWKDIQILEGYLLIIKTWNVHWKNFPFILISIWIWRMKFNNFNTDYMYAQRDCYFANDIYTLSLCIVLTVTILSLCKFLVWWLHFRPMLAQRKYYNRQIFKCVQHLWCARFDFDQWGTGQSRLLGAPFKDKSRGRGARAPRTDFYTNLWGTYPAIPIDWNRKFKTFLTNKWKMGK
jgi:hypothetical protein